jgi:REG-2-like HAD superfamily hydrolase
MAAGVTEAKPTAPDRRPLRTVFFDFGNTVATLSMSVPEVWSKVLRDRGHVVASEILEPALREADAELSPRLYDHLGRMREFWARYDGLVLDRLGIPDERGALAASIDQAFEDTHRWFRVYPEARDALRSLRGMGWNLGVISNNTEEIMRTLKDLDLAQYFDHVTFSQEAGAEKPDSAIFQLALRRARCQPDEAVHIGDKYEADVLGARGVGIEPILLDRENRWPNADCARVRDLREAVALIRGRNL